MMVFVPSRIRRTGRDHSLNKVADVTQNNAEALHRVRLARFGLHSLDLNALQDRVLYEAAARLKDAPVWC